MKVQSKLRTVSENTSSSVDIPKKYVDDNFVFFLYIESGQDEELLFTFFKEDIQQWRNRDGVYWLNFSLKSISSYQEKLFNKNIVAQLKGRLQAQEVKDYTSILIDGVFLDKAIQDTRVTYAQIWPGKEFITPSLEKVVRDLLYYNQFEVPNKTVNCIIFMSGHHGLETSVHMPKDNYLSAENLEIRIVKSSNNISFQLMQHLQRIINAENVMLVADDAVYEKELNALKDKGVELIILKQRTSEGSRMFTAHQWQDIAYVGVSAKLTPAFRN